MSASPLASYGPIGSLEGVEYYKDIKLNPKLPGEYSNQDMASDIAKVSQAASLQMQEMDEVLKAEVIREIAKRTTTLVTNALPPVDPESGRPLSPLRNLDGRPFVRVYRLEFDNLKGDSNGLDKEGLKEAIAINSGAKGRRLDWDWLEDPFKYMKERLADDASEFEKNNYLFYLIRVGDNYFLGDEKGLPQLEQFIDRVTQGKDPCSVIKPLHRLKPLNLPTERMFSKFVRSDEMSLNVLEIVYENDDEYKGETSKLTFNVIVRLYSDYHSKFCQIDLREVNATVTQPELVGEHKYLIFQEEIAYVVEDINERQYRQKSKMMSKVFKSEARSSSMIISDKKPSRGIKQVQHQHLKGKETTKTAGGQIAANAAGFGGVSAKSEIQKKSGCSHLSKLEIGDFEIYSDDYDGWKARLKHVKHDKGISELYRGETSESVVKSILEEHSGLRSNKMRFPVPESMNTFSADEFSITRKAPIDYNEQEQQFSIRMEQLLRLVNIDKKIVSIKHILEVLATVNFKTFDCEFSRLFSTVEVYNKEGKWVPLRDLENIDSKVVGIQGKNEDSFMIAAYQFIKLSPDLYSPTFEECNPHFKKFNQNYKLAISKNYLKDHPILKDLISLKGLADAGDMKSVREGEQVKEYRKGCHDVVEYLKHLLRGQPKINKKSEINFALRPEAQYRFPAEKKINNIREEAKQQGWIVEKENNKKRAKNDDFFIGRHAISSKEESEESILNIQIPNQDEEAQIQVLFNEKKTEFDKKSKDLYNSLEKEVSLRFSLKDQKEIEIKGSFESLKPPPHLLIQLERFVDKRSKILTKVDIPNGCFVFQGHLYSVEQFIVHHGDKPDNGSYVSYHFLKKEMEEKFLQTANIFIQAIMHPSSAAMRRIDAFAGELMEIWRSKGVWVKCDQEMVMRIDEEKAVEEMKQAYVFYAERHDTPNIKSKSGNETYHINVESGELENSKGEVVYVPGATEEEDGKTFQLWYHVNHQEEKKDPMVINEDHTLVSWNPKGKGRE